MPTTSSVFAMKLLGCDGKGKITLEYASLEEFDRMLTRLTEKT